MNESEETGTTEQLDATMPPVPHVPGVTDQYQYTPDDYRKFRTLLRIFRDAIAFNYAHFKEHDVRFAKPWKDITRFKKEFDITDDDWNILSDGTDISMQFGKQIYNRTGSAYINVGIINIYADFEVPHPGPDKRGDPGSEVQFLQAGINEKRPEIKEMKKRAKETPHLQELIGILTSPDNTYDQTNPSTSIMYAISTLGLDDDPTTEVNENCRELFDRFTALIAMRNAEKEENSTMNDDSFIPIRERIETASDREHPQNLIFHGAPGTGKTFGVLKAVIELVSDDEETVNSSQELSKRLKEEQKKESPRFRFVQFHPSYDYTDFVEGLRPNPDGNGFSLQAGTFMKFCADARDAQKKLGDDAPQYYFLIDEINRGDVSNIFGELFFLLDSGYHNVGIDTQYANMHGATDGDGETFAKRYLDDGKFTIPSNVTIIGTMNDIDRSVDSFDFAMRRRFHFVPVTAEDSIKMRDDLKDAPSYAPAIGLMNVINNVIGSKEPLQEPYKLGISYFADLAKTDPEDFDDAKDELWQNRIEPLLAEYIRGTDVQLVDFKNAWDGNTNSSAVGTESSAMADDENMNDDSDGEAND